MRFPDFLSLFHAGVFFFRNGFSRNWYWSFYSTAARKMYKPFLYYKNHLHGYPCQHSFKDSAIPEIKDLFIECTEKDWEDPNNANTSDAAQKAWAWVLGEIEFALKYEYDDEELDFVEIQNPDYDKVYTDTFDKQLKRNFSYQAWRDAFDDPRYGIKKHDRVASEANIKRAMRGFELMGKFWMNLWD